MLKLPTATCNIHKLKPRQRKGFRVWGTTYHSYIGTIRGSYSELLRPRHPVLCGNATRNPGLKARAPPPESSWPALFQMLSVILRIGALRIRKRRNIGASLTTEVSANGVDRILNSSLEGDWGLLGREPLAFPVKRPNSYYYYYYYYYPNSSLALGLALLISTPINL